ncbi:hypothetical protein [Caulobacter sp. Root343]|uniref:hypothetical protein n=1 Tax=Caulobacter sp. Root343 TaxID=1736520 RepID=UPI0006FF07BC|nr:hypothetical protein [Caulobacter sp. Root343]KQV66624.1 hypothetical protein ASC70_12385 [Caulobacter sp. Root343]
MGWFELIIGLHVIVLAVGAAFLARRMRRAKRLDRALFEIRRDEMKRRNAELFARYDRKVGR